jgi:type IV pilus assembly protein PilC
MMAQLKEILFEVDLFPGLQRWNHKRQRWRKAFLHQLAACVEAELSLSNSLDICLKEIVPRDIKRALRKVKASIDEGEYLADALRNHAPGLFPKSFCGILQIGEKSGQLAESLRILEKGYEDIQRIKRRAIGITMYPCMLGLVSMSILVFLIVRVIPTFAEIYSDLNASLPAPTRVLISLADILIANLQVLIPALLLVAVAPILLLRLSQKIYLLNKLLFAVPFFGTAFYHWNVFHFCTLLSMLLRSGMPIDEALSLYGNDAGWPVFEKAAKSIRQDILNGETFSDSLKRGQIFSPTLIWFSFNGEQRGDLPAALASASEYETSVMEDWGVQVQMLEPVGILAASLVIGFVIVSMMLPVLGMAKIFY